MRNIFYGVSYLYFGLVGLIYWIWPPVLWSLVVALPVIGLGLYDVLQTRHTILRNFPILGHGRYLMESIRPEIQQYFVERDTDENPISREMRAIVYQRAKQQLDTHPFGTQRDVYEPGHEWVSSSINAGKPPEDEPLVTIGGDRCEQPYDASIFNISAMSFGSLSPTAVEAMNKGAARGGFLHNTGEGGLSSYHLEYGADLTFQLGTAYFGCRTSEGRFDPGQFETIADHPEVKMVELKLSQGAKPGHGGVLPGDKVSEEIAEIRGIPPGEDIVSPPSHREFSTPRGLLEFLDRLRDLSGGKPVGFKFCPGQPAEFLSICKAMADTGRRPDFITVDGGEGGTGAAPLEFVNSMGTPFREGLNYVHNALRGVDLRDEIRIFGSSKIITGFDLFRTLALGADLTNAARAMMLAVGCIQARRCNSNSCPTGVATQDPELYETIDVDDKGDRVVNYHRETVASLLELVAAAGLESPREIQPRHVMQRVDENTVRHYGQIYPHVETGCLLRGEVPEWMQRDWSDASPDTFQVEAEEAPV